MLHRKMSERAKLAYLAGIKHQTLVFAPLALIFTFYLIFLSYDSAIEGSRSIRDRLIPDRIFILIRKAERIREKAEAAEGWDKVKNISFGEMAENSLLQFL